MNLAEYKNEPWHQPFLPIKGKCNDFPYEIIRNRLGVLVVTLFIPFLKAEDFDSWRHEGYMDRLLTNLPTQRVITKIPGQWQYSEQDNELPEPDETLQNPVFKYYPVCFSCSQQGDYIPLYHSGRENDSKRYRRKEWVEEEIVRIVDCLAQNHNPYQFVE